MEYDPERITLFAKTDARGQQLPFGIKAKDRTRHVYVIGKTGMGKSTLLENMAVQDIKNGEGMAFIDPHGQTAETLLDYIPEERKKDVLYFAPFDMDHPVSFNVMEDVGPDKRHLVVSGLMSTFKKIWVDAWSARMEYILSNTLLALLEYPDSTLLGVNRMLSDKVYRKKVIDNISDPAVKSFWVDEFLKYNERYMQEAGDAIKNKIGQFTANPLIRNIIGQPKSSFDVRQMMDDRKILIMNLSKGLIGETNANLLGSMLITRIYLSAMSRAELSPGELGKLSNFYFYVDEFQSFANEAFANILSEARKYKLNLTIAHQYIEQMEEEVKNAVFGNVGTTISFRVGPFDAEVLETIFQPKFYAVDICNLGFAQIYLSLMIDGIGSQPFSAVTLPPIQPDSVSCKDMVIHESRQQYTSPRQTVEQNITDWHGTEPARDGASNNGGNKPPHQPDRKPKFNQSNGGGNRNGRDHNTNGNNDRNSERNQPKDRRESNSRPPHREYASQKPKPKEKDLNELRDILKGMVKKEELKPAASSKTEPVRETTPTPPKRDQQSDNKPKERITPASTKSEQPAKPNNQASKRPENKAVKPSEGQSKEKAPKLQAAGGNDLKSALESALKGLDKKPAPPAEQKPQEKLVNSVKKNQSESKQEQIPKPNNNHHVEKIVERVKEARAAESSKLHPKQLERMMRVTTSDKSPLK